MACLIRSRVLPALAIIAVSIAPLARAQHSLVVIRPNGMPGLMMAAVVTGDGVRAEVANSAGLLHALPDSTIFTLASAPIWAAGLVDVSHLAVQIAPGDENLSAHGYLQADVSIPNCVLVIVAKSPAMKVVAAHNDLKIYPLPPSGTQNLPAGSRVAFNQRWDLGSQFNYREGSWEMHIFSNGVEVPTTAMTPAEIAAARTKSDDYLLHDHPVMLILGAAPGYPESLKARNIGGSATVRCPIDLAGINLAPAIVSATDPAFGKAVLETAANWLFFPAVKDHHYVGQTVEIPINFRPPNATPASAGATSR